VKKPAVTKLPRLTKLQRLYCDAPLAADLEVRLTDSQVHYLTHVLRMKTGENILVFNGCNGEWQAQFINKSKKEAWLYCLARKREQTVPTSLIYCFAPLKMGRLDYMVQKAVEMGASRLQPVITDFTQNTRLNLDRMRANVIEAAEQCGILSLPFCSEPMSLGTLLQNWQPDYQLIFCDEAKAGSNPLTHLMDLKNQPPDKNCGKNKELEQLDEPNGIKAALGLLIGPEGGFSEKERKMLQEQPFVTAIGLGSRILRADTAAVAAMALIGATIGDWGSNGR